MATDASVGKQLRGDLDNIVLKALRKDPERRYGGMGSFSEDIRRHLENLPILARKETVGYHAIKFFKRNKLGVAAALLVFTTLLAGVIATAFEARLATTQRIRAERRFNDIRRIANSLVFELHNAIADIPGALEARQLITQRALEYLDSLAQEADDDLSLKNELATAYTRIGRVTFDVKQAIKSHQTAIALREEIQRTTPDNVPYRKQLSESYFDFSDVMKISGNSAQAINYAKKSLEILQPIATTHPKENEVQEALADRYLALGIALSDGGDLKRALEADLKAMQIEQEIIRQSPDKESLRSLSRTYATLSNVYEDEEDFATALEYTHKAANISEDLFREDPSSAGNRRDMWAVCLRSGRELARTGDTKEALANYERAVDLIENLVKADPKDRGHRRWLAVTYSSYGDFLASLDRTEDAHDRYRSAIATCEKLLANDPDRTEVKRDLAGIHQSIGLLFAKNGDNSRAIESLNTAIGLARAAMNQDPNNARIERRIARISADMAACYRSLATTQSQRTDLQNSSDWYQQSLQLWEDLKRRDLLNQSDPATVQKIQLDLENVQRDLAKSS